MSKQQLDDQRQEGFDIDSELRRAAAEFFDASEKLFHLAIERQKKGKLPKDAERPETIAFEAVMHALRDNSVCPEWAARAVTQRWQEFKGFKHDSLGVAFGIPDHKHRHAQRDRLLCSAVYHNVRALQSQGMPLKDSAKGDGALTTTGNRFRMSGKKVEQLMKHWRDLCRATGADPDAKPIYGDVRKAAARALRALRPPS